MNKPKKALVIGIDGCVTKLVEQHIAEGICPNVEKIFKNGVRGQNNLCPMPTITPPNWTCISTGAWPITHQVTDFYHHIPGTTPLQSNIHTSFSCDYCKAETIFEAAERAGKTSLIVNYPAAYNLHKRLKNSIVVGGSGLSVGTIQDEEASMERGGPSAGGQVFCNDLMVSSQMRPRAIQAEMVPAKAWKNIDDEGDDPQEIEFNLLFGYTPFKPAETTWYWLIRDMEGDGYDTVSLSPTRDFNDVFFTIKTNEWSKLVRTDIKMQDGSAKEVTFLAKILKLNDDGTEFDFFMTHMLNTDGEHWIYPPEKAAVLKDIDVVPTSKAGMYFRVMDWYDDDMFEELIEMHNKWLGEAICKLMDDTDWTLCFFHTHPTDSIYHHMMTDLDPATTPSKEAYDHAWKVHRNLWISTDAMIGKIMEKVDDETIVIMVSDHGSKADGYGFIPTMPLIQAGLLEVDESTLDITEGDRIYIDSFREGPQRDAWVKSFAAPVVEKSKALAQRTCFIYVNLKGRYPGGIVEPEDYEKVQREIIDALYTYVDPVSGMRPVALALTKEDARVIGMGGEQCGDVVYSLYPEFGSQHGAALATVKISIGDLSPLGVFHGPGFKKDFEMERTFNIVDVVPTICYMLGLPYPTTCEGSVLYQALEDPDAYTCK